MNFKLAVVGNANSILLYRAFGVESFAVATSSECQKKTEELFFLLQNDEKKIPQFAVIFVEDEFYKNFSADLLEKFARRPLPAVVPVPSSGKNKNFAKNRLRKIVERAVGSDILN